jgi:hypothetical protein
VRYTEDEGALTFLAAFSFWLFIWLPILHGTEPMTPWTQILFAFVGGSLVTSLFGLAYTWWRKPVISAKLVDKRGCYVTTSRGNPATHEARFLRLLIENTGRSTIKDCAGYITGITKAAHGATNVVEQEVIELGWSHSGSKIRSIPCGAFFSKAGRRLEWEICPITSYLC